MINFKKVMVLAPHTDDGEFGCGATLTKLRELGSEIFYTAFSVCEQSVPYGFKEDELERELMNAASVLGIPESNVIVHRHEVRKFPEKRQAILQDIIDVKKDVKPDLVLLPSLNDIHQDHAVIAIEGLRAYKQTTILSYEVPWNNLNFNNSTFIHLEDRHVQKKIDALKCYKTQAFRNYANADFIRSLARTRGVQVGGDLAEVFELVRLIMK
jgi:N-acetylglucosamine malate deacetylase 1